LKAVRSAPSTFAELRAFACAEIPDLLREADGELDKERMVEEVARRFAAGRQWPEDLDRVNATGVRAGRNAIAWAMRDLVVGGQSIEAVGRHPDLRGVALA
jgi:hypothetical protein